MDPVYELQDAAINYEAAARARERIAHTLIGDLRAEPSGEEEEAKSRHQRLGRNAAIELQASGQLTGAASEWDHTARVWRNAASATREGESREYFSQASRAATGRATALIRQAAELAERAALNYAAAGDLNGQIRANHTAGKIREQLAKRG